MRAPLSLDVFRPHIGEVPEDLPHGHHLPDPRVLGLVLEALATAFFGEILEELRKKDIRGFERKNKREKDLHKREKEGKKETKGGGGREREKERLKERQRGRERERMKEREREERKISHVTNTKNKQLNNISKEMNKSNDVKKQ